MADLLNYEVRTVGGQIRVSGKVVDSSNQSVELANFGPNGISVITWIQGLPVSAQEELVRNAISPYMVRNLLGQWPLVIPTGRVQP